MPRRRASEDPSLPIIANNMKAIRDDLKLKQGDVASRAGVDRAMLSRWEKGHQKPEVDALLKLATVYECSVEDFIAGVNHEYDKLTERGIGVNVRRHYQARYAELRQMAMKAVSAITTSVVETAPTSIRPADSELTTRGKSGPARARRGRKK